METWNSKVAVETSTATARATAMSNTLLDSLSIIDMDSQVETHPSPQRVELAILSIASDLQSIMEVVMTTAKAILPQKSAAPKKGTLPKRLWLKSVRHDVDKIRRRVKTL